VLVKRTGGWRSGIVCKALRRSVRAVLDLLHQQCSFEAGPRSRWEVERDFPEERMRSGHAGPARAGRLSSNRRLAGVWFGIFLIHVVSTLTTAAHATSTRTAV
jgi:hypothetical protein